MWVVGMCVCDTIPSQPPGEEGAASISPGSLAGCNVCVCVGCECGLVWVAGGGIALSTLHLCVCASHDVSHDTSHDAPQRLTR